MDLSSAKPAVSGDQVREQLARILLDPLFQQSQRLSVLLRFLVESKLAGRESELKEFVIGAEAFERGAGFDPQVDNIVRVTAARLRSRLAEYYQSAGSSEPVVITLPKGGYIPSFAAMEPHRPASAPSPLASPPSGATVGRQAELDHLRTSLTAATSGTSRIVAITGEAGIGKTALTERFLSGLEASSEPVWILQGRCSERLSDSEPFLPIFECLEDILQDQHGREVHALMEKIAPAWLSQLEPVTEGAYHEQSAERFRRQFVRFLRGLSEIRPVVVSLEDLHWVDASTVDLLSYVSSHLRNLRLLLIVTYRPLAILSARPFLSWKLSLERKGECRELSLMPLSSDEVGLYIDHLFPQNQFPAGFVSSVYERTEGHPLSMCDMLRYVVNRGIVSQSGGVWRLEGDVAELRRLIPAGALNVIRLEIARMPEPDRALLECAAVYGIHFDSATLSKVLEMDPAGTEERLGRLAIAEHFISHAGETNTPGQPSSLRFRFLHALYQNALYAEIPPTRRVTLSLAIAMALTASEPAPGMAADGEIAILFECGREPAVAAQYFLRASRHAIAVFAYPEAVLLCRRGLDNLLALPQSPVRDARELDFSLILGLALMVTCGYAAPEVEAAHQRSRELCLRLNQLKHLVRVLWGIHTCLVNAGELIPSLEVATEMRRLANLRNDPEALIQSLHAAGTTLAFMGRVAEARPVLEEGLRLLASMEPKPRRSLYILDTGVTYLCMLAKVLARLGDFDQAIEKVGAALELANSLEHPPSITYATFWIGWVHHARGDFAAACDPLETAMEMSRKYGLPQFLEWSRLLRGSSMAHLGRPAEGVAELRLSVENQLSMRCMLPDAAQQGDLAALKSLLPKSDVNLPQGDGMTALHWAAYREDLEMVRVLLQSGANVNASNRLQAVTPLLIASKAGNAAMIRLLLKSGADPNLPNALGTTPLMLAAASGKVDAVKALLDGGADVNARETARRQTALMFAAALNRDAVVRVLASRGADLNLTSKIVPINNDIVDEDGNSIPAPSRTGKTRQRGEAEGKVAGMGGMTALHYAAREGLMATVQALVESGVNVNKTSPVDKSTALVVAICNGHYDVAKYLVEHDADPNIETIDGLGALYATIESRWAPVAWTPTPFTSSSGITQQQVDYLSVIKLLLDHGANPNAKINKTLWFDPPHHNDSWAKAAGATPFWRAAQATDLDAMKLLLAHGADPKVPSAENDTPLAVAAGVGWNGNFSTNAPNSFLAAVKYLVEEVKIDVNAADTSGYTALMGAAYRGDNDVVQYLIEKGARVDVKTKRGWSVTDMANGPYLRSSFPLAHPETIALLLKHNAPEPIKVQDEEILGVKKEEKK